MEEGVFRSHLPTLLNDTWVLYTVTFVAYSWKIHYQGKIQKMYKEHSIHIWRITLGLIYVSTIIDVQNDRSLYYKNVHEDQYKRCVN